MTMRAKIRKLEHWLTLQPNMGDVKYVREGSLHLVSTEVRTTSTRASSMVTRFGLIAQEVMAGSHFSVSKSPALLVPCKREDLATWKITVAIPAKKTAGVERLLEGK